MGRDSICRSRWRQPERTDSPCTPTPPLLGRVVDARSRPPPRALRFSAARYWIPFYAPVILLALVYAPRWLTSICIPASLGLGLALASDDLDL